MSRQRTIHTAPVRAREKAIWLPFVRAALLLAGTAGFSLGAALFAVSLAGGPIGPWWPAAAQAHGHIQLFGWAGLMVLGVGVHFLPRLRGTTLLHPERARIALVLLVAGLVGRAFCQPLLAQSGATEAGTALHVGVILAALLELGGAGILLSLIAMLLRRGPPLRQRAGLWPVLGLFITAFGAYGLALVVNAFGALAAAPSSGGLVPDRLDDLTNTLAFYGFLLPIAVAMAARTFPMFFRTPHARRRLLHAGLVLLLLGVALRGTGELLERALFIGCGDVLLAPAIGVFIHALGVVAPRRPLPRQPVRPFRDPTQWHVLTAFIWLALVALLLVWEGAAVLGLPVPAVSPDAERHAMGAGFVTLLIFGLGVHLLPGFAGRRLRSPLLVWLTLVAANLAAVLRVIPLLVPWPAVASNNALLALAGVAGLVAIVGFGVNLRLWLPG